MTCVQHIDYKMLPHSSFNMHVFIWKDWKNKVREKVRGKKRANSEANSFPGLMICSIKSRNWRFYINVICSKPKPLKEMSILTAQQLIVEKRAFWSKMLILKWPICIITTVLNCVDQSNAYAVIITSRQSFKWLLLATHFGNSPLKFFVVVCLRKNLDCKRRSKHGKRTYATSSAIY
jgi:hypothetical protein